MTDKSKALCMTKREHARLVAGGCDPHCHACNEAVVVGARWYLRAVELDIGLGNMTLRWMCCARCNREKRPLPGEQLTDLSGRLQAWADKYQPPAPAVPRESVGAGCFMLPDGTLLP